MPMVDPRTWMEILPPHECRHLLSTHSVGRLGFIVDGHPEIVPVNYVYDGEHVFFRTDQGTKLTAALDWPSVAFEIDHIDTEEQWGWSVLIVGRGDRVVDNADLRRSLDRLPEPWVPGRKEVWVRITPRRITGRRIRP